MSVTDAEIEVAARCSYELAVKRNHGRNFIADWSEMNKEVKAVWLDDAHTILEAAAAVRGDRAPHEQINLSYLVRAEKAETERDAMQAVAFQAQEMAKEQMAQRDAAVADTIERCAQVADGWLMRFADGDIKYTPASEYASDAVRDIADAIRALAKTPPGDGWQPIETAPKDGTHVLLWDPLCDIPIGCFWDEDTDEWLLSWDQTKFDKVKPPSATNWRPLPAPPSVARKVRS